MLSNLSVVLPIFALILAGFMARRTGALGPNATREVNRLVVYLALPALLFDIMATADLAAVWRPGFIAAFSIGCAVVFGLTLMLRMRAGAPLADAAIDGLNASYANTGFVGFPLALAVIGAGDGPDAGRNDFDRICAVRGCDHLDRDRLANRWKSARNICPDGAVAGQKPAADRAGSGPCVHVRGLDIAAARRCVFETAGRRRLALCADRAGPVFGGQCGAKATAGGGRRMGPDRRQADWPAAGHLGGGDGLGPWRARGVSGHPAICTADRHGPFYVGGILRPQWIADRACRAENNPSFNCYNRGTVGAGLAPGRVNQRILR
ncbi:putative malonate transporter, AEC family protein [Ketogulonicigenium vulgare WSH-001]|uniref:Putative malonate transporter, AEC family protein n=1 Tax=Ketogulonicigenium vulgare (strain WSH-001) TaxID=759362 RepID=F9Y735_KETVW|nr:putative malonate transporter, AEC family protein [Ketogulonicigenium vulgare WSH-001]